MVHCTCEELAPPEFAREIFKVTAPPDTELPELIEAVTCCASAWLVATPSSRHMQPRTLVMNAKQVQKEFIKMNLRWPRTVRLRTASAFEL